MGMISLFLRRGLLMAIVAAFAAAANAQPVSGSAASVEWAAADCCAIVRAVIDDVSIHELKDGLYPNAGVRRYQTVTARVLDTLKGEHADRLQFVNDGDFRGFRLAELQAKKQELLLFLDPSLRRGIINFATGEYAYARFPLAVAGAIVLNDNGCRWTHTNVPVLSARLDRLVSAKQTLDAVKAYVDGHSQRTPVRSETMELPPKLRGGYYKATLTIPADEDSSSRGQARPTEQAILDFEQFEERFAKPPPADGKPSFSRKGTGAVSVYALEAMAADCDAIVRGAIEKACFVARTDGPKGDSYGVRLRVIEWIKGKVGGGRAEEGRAGDRVACYVIDAGDLDTLRREETEIVLFMRANQDQGVAHPYGALEYRVRGGHWDDSAIVLDGESADGQSAEVLFADLTWHRKSDEIIERLRGAVKEASGDDAAMRSRYSCAGDPPPLFRFHPPTTVAADSTIEGNPHSHVYLPIDRSLEENARKWAAADSKDLRWVAARAMVYFKSDENAAILRRMLDDDATWGRREMLHMTGLSHPYEPELLVRWEAWHVLAGWGYDAPRPEFAIRGMRD
jgi:hypothetical protein